MDESIISGIGGGSGGGEGKKKKSSSSSSRRSHKTPSTSSSSSSTSKDRRNSTSRKKRSHSHSGKGHRRRHHRSSRKKNHHHQENKKEIFVDENRNWLIHLLYVRNDFEECLILIKNVLENTTNPAKTFFALYIKAMILRKQGMISECLSLLQELNELQPNNSIILKQIARSLYLLGQQETAISVYDLAISLMENQPSSSNTSSTNSASMDWEIYQNKGICHMYIRQYDEALRSYEKANLITKHDSTFILMGKLFIMQEEYQKAIDVLTDALDNSPSNTEILTMLGFLFLQTGSNFKAFEYFGNSLSHDPKNIKAILGAGSIIQDHDEVEMALMKYRIAAAQTPNSPQLWNNIGICFFVKERFVGAVACLKRALYYAPLEWTICYNLGLVHLCTQQYASAFHFFSAAINIKPDFAASYMYLAVSLSNVRDFENSCSAYKKAIEMEPNIPLFRLNYAISLYRNEMLDECKIQFQQFLNVWNEMKDQQTTDPQIIEQKNLLTKHLDL